MQHATSIDACAEIIAKQRPTDDIDAIKATATNLLGNFDREQRNVHLLLPLTQLAATAPANRELFEYLIRRKWADLFDTGTERLTVTKSAKKIEFEHKDDHWAYTLVQHNDELWWKLEFTPDPKGNCSICNERGPDVRTICRHLFHEKCLVEWVSQSAYHDCPTCRTQLLLFFD